MKTILRLTLAAAVAFGIFFAPNASQAADTVAVEFVGTASINPGLGYPAVGTPADNAQWAFESTVACADNAGTSCYITANGTLDGYCGASTTTHDGQGVYISSNGTSHQLTEVGWIQSAGGTIVVTGNADGKPFVVLVQAVPTGGSCANNTATQFTVNGTGTFLP